PVVPSSTTRAQLGQQLAHRTNPALLGASPGRLEVGMQRGALLRVQIVTLVFHGEVQGRTLRERRRLVDDDAPALDLRTDDHDRNLARGSRVSACGAGR